MEDTKKTVLAGNGEKDVPRAVYDGVLTIDTDIDDITKENVDSAIPWKKDAYLAGIKEGKFPYDLAYYEAKMKERESKTK